MSKENLTVGQRIKERRLSLNKQRGGFTQDEVAEKISELRGKVISRPGYAHWETGTNDVAISDLPHLAKVFECPQSYFTGEEALSSLEDEDAIVYYRKMPEILKPAAQAVMKALYESGMSK